MTRSFVPHERSSGNVGRVRSFLTDAPQGPVGGWRGPFVTVAERPPQGPPGGCARSSLTLLRDRLIATHDYPRGYLCPGLHKLDCGMVDQRGLDGSAIPTLTDTPRPLAGRHGSCRCGRTWRGRLRGGRCAASGSGRAAEAVGRLFRHEHASGISGCTGITLTRSLPFQAAGRPATSFRATRTSALRAAPTMRCRTTPRASSSRTVGVRRTPNSSTRSRRVSASTSM